MAGVTQIERRQFLATCGAAAGAPRLRVTGLELLPVRPGFGAELNDALVRRHSL